MFFFQRIKPFNGAYCLFNVPMGAYDGAEVCELGAHIC